MAELDGKRRKLDRGRYKKFVPAREAPDDVLPMEYSLGSDWGEVQEQCRQQRNARLLRQGEDLIPREPGWMVHEDQSFLDDQDIRTMTLEVWRGMTTSRTMHDLQTLLPDLDVVASKVAVQAAQMHCTAGWMNQLVLATSTIRSEVEVRVSLALSVIAKMIQRINFYEQVLGRGLHPSATFEVPCDEVQEELRQVGAETLAAYSAADGALTGALASRMKELREAEDTIYKLRSENNLLKKKVADFDVDFTNLKDHFEEDKKLLEEKVKDVETLAQRRAERATRFKNQVIYAATAAAGKFREGFCLARKQVIEQYPGIDLSGLDSRQMCAADPSWLGPEFWFSSGHSDPNPVPSASSPQVVEESSNHADPKL